jgi:predicted NBD/HSP70 family sugar kinase
MEMPEEKATRKHSKDHNTRLVFQVIYHKQPISRAEVSRQTKLTPTTVSHIVKDLIQDELVAEVGSGPSSGGRTPELLCVIKDGRHIIAVDLYSAAMWGCLINLRGDIKQRRSKDLGDGSKKQIMSRLFGLIDELQQLSRKIPLLGIGVSVTGLVNPDTGVLMHSDLLNLDDIHFKQDIEECYEKYKLPVYVMNDGQALALGEYTEYTLMPRQQVNNLIVIKTGVGIGSGLVFNGKVFNGDGYAGEFGDFVVVDGEERIKCKCGNFGCLATVASDQMIIERARKRASKNSTSTLNEMSELSLDHISEAAKHGDSVARDIIEETGRYFGRAMGYLVNMLNVHHIFVSGPIKVLDIEKIGECPLKDPLLWKAMDDEMRKYGRHDLAEKTTIRIVEANSDNILIGAATQLLTHWYGIVRFIRDREIQPTG